MTLAFPVEDKANELLSRDPLALLVAMVLDQQVPLEKAFSSPYVLVRRLGHEPDAAELAGYDPAALAEIFATPPALHRFPRSMAGRVQEACRIVVERYDGDPAAIWSGAATGADALKRIGELPGFGTQKAQIFLALLGKQLGVRPPGWQEACGPFGADGTYLSVADITGAESLGRVREYKKQKKAAAKEAAAVVPAKVSGRKSPAKRAVKGAAKTTGRKAAAKTPAKKTPAKKTPAKKTPAKKTPAKKTPAKQALARQAPAKQAAKAPVKRVTKAATSKSAVKADK